MKTTIIQPIRWIYAGLMIAGGMLLFNGCVIRESGPGYSGEAYYDYQYYPTANVYYYPRGQVYYWNESGTWRSGRELPPTIVVRNEHYEHYRSHSTEPWTERHQDEGKAGQIQHENGDDYYYHH